ncbi:MAG TPA: DUF302 domain-containing protein [Rhizobiales bacterium]|nr:DUF302 domain-containing protein [Hyphomicrobiales bacterium]
MSYHFSKTIDMPFDEAVEKVTQVLADNGFGVLTKIDVGATLKKKLDVEFRPYVILGSCNPGYAHKALLAEDKIGTMLPCNVILQEHEPGKVEVSAVDPAASMAAIKNPDLEGIAGKVREMLKGVIDAL